jgi:hypothetical protein
MPSGEAESLMANSTSGMSDGQLSCRSETKERRTSAMTPLTRSVRALVLWWCGDPKMSEVPKAA